MIWPGKQISWKDFFKRLAHDYSEDAVSTTAAALTYYSVLALFPFLLFLVALGGLVLDPQATTNLIQQLGRVAPPQVTSIIGDRVQAVTSNPSGGLLTVGILGAYWSASGAVTSLTQALNRCYDVRETRPFWKKRGLALLITLAASAVAIIAAAVMFFVPVLGHYIGGVLGAAITWIRFLVAGAIAMAMWALLYWALPNVKKHRFQLVSAGSVVGVVLWLLASWGFSEYVRHSHSYDATYGSIGGIIILLVWMYISSMVVLLGAEINKILTPAEKLKQAESGEARQGKEAPPAAQGKPTQPGQPQPA